jgi:hypothetical protein
MRVKTAGYKEPRKNRPNRINSTTHRTNAGFCKPVGYKKQTFQFFPQKFRSWPKFNLISFLYRKSLSLHLLAIKLERRVFMDSNNYSHCKITNFFSKHRSNQHSESMRMSNNEWWKSTLCNIFRVLFLLISCFFDAGRNGCFGK